MKLNWSHIETSEVNGPGLRAVLWVQGCTHRCEGCFNKHTWPRVPVNLDEPELAATILLGVAETNGCEGITISGGEPLQQAIQVRELIRFVKKENPELSVVMFTGYTWEEVQAHESRKNAIEQVDILIAGRYDRLVPQVHEWAGSGNQTVHHLTGRYQERLTPKKTTQFEIHVTSEGIVASGFPTEKALSALGAMSRDSESVGPGE